MNTYAERRSTPILLLPIVLMWRLVTLVANITGILAAILGGLLLMMLGMFFTSTFFGAIIGIPIFILGLLLLIRGLY